MPYEATIDFQELLAPIAGDNPAGENLLYTGLHDEVREARRADDVLDQGEWKRESKVADWPLVIRLTTEALAKQTKDLQIAAWLTEALLTQHGFAGLADGLHLMRELIDGFWDTLYPEIDEGDLEARANALDILNRPFFLAALQNTPITGNPVGTNYSYLEYQDSIRFDVPDNADNLEYDERERVAALRQLAAAEGKVTSEQWRTAKSASNRAFYEDLHALLSRCWDEYRALDDLMDEKFQRQTPGLSDFKKTLEAVKTTVEGILKEKRLLEPDPADLLETGDSVAGKEGTAGGMRAGGRVTNRQEAIRRLNEVAEFFRSTEPHSPVSYLLQRAIHWGQIPLEDWLNEVVKDPSVLAHIRETLGLRPGDEQ